MPWITKAKAAPGRNETRDRTRLMEWLKRDDRSLGGPGKNPRCGDMAETSIRIGLGDEPLLAALGAKGLVKACDIEPVVWFVADKRGR